LRISFVGTGIMASSMIRCILEKNLVDSKNILGSAPRITDLLELKERYSVNVTQNNIEAAQFGDIVVISTKPQAFGEVASEIREYLKETQIILSIMAGVDIETLQTALLHKKIARAMPNTPVQIGKGMTVWTTTRELNIEEKEEIKQILSSLGKEFYVKEESYVDMATALSGTGPAYAFLFLESLINAGVHLGFSRKDSTELVYETVLGSVLFAMNSRKHTAELRDMVTSPGGTTTDALYELEKGGFRTVLEKAVHSAFKKTLYLKELNKREEGGK